MSFFLFWELLYLLLDQIGHFEFYKKYHSNAKDFSTEIIPNLLGKIYTYHTYKPWIDIGNIKSLKEARKISKKLNKNI